MDAQKSAVIFCSASFSIAPEYNEVAREVVRATAAKGYAIVSGGTIKGTMKVVADEASACGTGNIGIIPRYMEQYLYPNLTELIWTDSLSERKVLMRRRGADLAVTLPGGIGTLDEFFETYTLAKLGLYKGKIVVYNFNGFYDRLRDMMDFYVSTGMLDSATRSLVHFPETIQEYESLI